MRFHGASHSSPGRERRRGNLRGYVLDDEQIRATADTSGGVDAALAGTIRDSDTLSAQPQLLRAINDDDQVRAAPGIIAIVRDDDMVRATADLGDFGYERDFVLRAVSELPAETLTDFFVLGYEVTSTSFKSLANGGRIQQASAFDLFMQDAAGAQIDHNVVSFNGTTGALMRDFRIPAPGLVLGSDFRHRLRYGRAGVTTTYGNSAGCFARAAAVWEWSAGTDLTLRNRDLTGISGVSTSTLKGPCAVFALEAAAICPAATWVNGFTAASMELWLRPSSLPSSSTVYRLGTSDLQTVKFNLFVNADGSMEVITAFGSRAWVQTGAGVLLANVDQHIVVVGQSGALPLIYKDGTAVPTTTVTAPGAAGPLATTSADDFAFGVNQASPGGVALPGKYGRALFWPFALSAGWVATTYALQARPEALLGMGPELTAGTANRAPVAIPMFGTQAELEVHDYDVVQRSYDAEGDTRTASVASAATGLTASVVSGKVRVRPDGGTGGTTLEQPVRVTDALGRTSDTVVRVSVTAPTVGFNQALPYGGLGDGIPVLIGLPGNRKIVSTITNVYPIEYLGAVKSVTWNHRIDAFGSKVGYHTGDGGDVKVELWTMTSQPGASTVTRGRMLATTAVFTNLLTSNCFNSEWVAYGGTSGAVDRDFWEYPSVRFLTPPNLAAEGLVIDPTRPQGYLLVTWRNSGGSSNNVSVNHNFCVQHSLDNNTGYKHYRYSNTGYDNSGSGFTADSRQIPFFGLEYTDGHCRGPSHQGAATANGLTYWDISAANALRLRMCLPVRRSGVVLYRVSTWWTRQGTNTGTTGALRLQIRKATNATVPDPTTDEGTLVYQADIAASAIPYTSGNSKDDNGSSISSQQNQAQTYTLPTPIALENGATYYYVLQSTGVEMRGHPECNTFARKPAGFGYRESDGLSVVPRQFCQRFLNGTWQLYPDARGGTGHNVAIWASYVP